MARNALNPSSNSAISSFKRTSTHKSDMDITQKDKRHEALPPPPPPVDRTKQAPCPDCGRKFFVFTEYARGWNRRPHERCKECFLARRRCRSGVQHSVAGANAVTTEEGPLSQISSITPTCHGQGQHRTPPASNPQAVILQHHIFTSGEWRRARVTKYPTVRLRLSIDYTAPGSRHAPHSPVFTDVNANF